MGGNANVGGFGPFGRCRGHQVGGVEVAADRGHRHGSAVALRQMPGDRVRADVEALLDRFSRRRAFDTECRAINLCVCDATPYADVLKHNTTERTTNAVGAGDWGGMRRCRRSDRFRHGTPGDRRVFE